MASLPTEWVSFATALADAARPIAQRYFRSHLSVDTKADNSPVTQADREIEAVLRSMIEERFPTHGIWGEEQRPTHIDAEYVWVIDPIDGTRAFIAGVPTFTTLIALCQRGVPMLGIIDQPIRDERWIGVAGQPSTYNGSPLQMRPLTPSGTHRLSTTSLPYFTPKERKAFDHLSNVSAATLLNQDGYGYGLLALGHVDMVIDAHMKPYDFCALAPVIQGAGGEVSDWAGHPLSLHGQGDVIATTHKMLHTQVLGLLKIAANR